MGRVCVGAQEEAGGGPSFLHEAGGTALEATFVSGPGRGRRGFSCLKSSCPRVKSLSWFPHFWVVARASVYPSVRCRNSPFLWQRWGRQGRVGDSGSHGTPGVEEAGSLRDRQTRHGGQGHPGPQPARSGPQVAPRGCGCGSLAAPAAAGVSAGLVPACVSVTAAVGPSFTGHPHPPCVLGTPGVAPRPSEAKAQTERATRGGNRGVQWGCAVPGIPACGVHGRGVGVLAGVLCWAGDFSFVSPTPPPKAPGGGDDLPRSKPWCPCV